MFARLRRILKRNSELEQQAMWLYECWFRYTLNDERTHRALIGLFELIPEKIKFQIIRDIRKKEGEDY